MEKIKLSHSPDIGAFAEALAKAQLAIGKAIKDSTNPHFKSTYADLASVSDACRPALNSNGIAVIQSPYDEDDKIGVVTMLVHSSGQWMRGELAVRPGKADAQAAGSVITYFRRYSLAAMAGVAPEDDDGNAASAPAPEKSKQQQKPDRPAQQPADAAIVNAASDAINACRDIAALNQLWAMSAAAWRAEMSAAGFDYIVGQKDAKKADLTTPTPDQNDPNQPPF